jgi:prepilin-type N-terminal cleavage/methylation domain-containing protein
MIKPRYKRCTAHTSMQLNRMRLQGSEQGRKQPLHAQRGVSLLEVMVVVAILALLVPSIMAMVQPFMNFYGKVNTDNRLKDLRTAITATYNTYAVNIDTQSTATLTTPDGTLSQVLPVSNQCAGTSATFAAAKRFLSTSANEIYRDGFGHSFCVWITPRLSASYSGVTYYYHNALIVSPGVDGAIDATTMLNADGSITVGGDDRSAFVDGRSIVLAKLQQTSALMDRIAAAYQNYFTTRYMVNTSRDTAVSYFANGAASWGTTANWDAGGWVVSTAGAAQALTWNHLYQGLGLSLSDVIDAWGQTIQLDNSSNATRNPDNQVSATMQSPPYTAILSTSLPGGLTMVRTVTGTY